MLGRFLQTDLVGYEDDLNFYTYVRNDPLNGSDTSGTACAGGPCEEMVARKSRPRNQASREYTAAVVVTVAVVVAAPLAAELLPAAGVTAGGGGGVALASGGGAAAVATGEATSAGASAASTAAR